MDKEQVILRLNHLKEYLRILKLLQKFKLSEIENDPFKKGALLHYLQLCAEISIDVGQMIIVSENFQLPHDSSDIFLILGKEKILNQQFAKKFSPIARFRNLIVHEYAKIDMKKVYHYLTKDLDQFDIFAKAVVRYIKRKY